jgi:hypothetical protein
VEPLSTINLIFLVLVLLPVFVKSKKDLVFLNHLKNPV